MGVERKVQVKRSALRWPSLYGVNRSTLSVRILSKRERGAALHGGPSNVLAPSRHDKEGTPPMETQSWKNAGVEWRRPDIADVILSAVAWYVLHTDPQIPEVVAAVTAFILLRCVRRNPSRTRR